MEENRASWVRFFIFGDLADVGLFCLTDAL